MNARTGSLLVVFAVLEFLALRGTPIWMADFAVYEAAGHTVREGVSLYDLRVTSSEFGQMAYTYPPFAALVFVPLSLLPAAAAEAVWLVLTVFALAAVVRLARPTLDGWRLAALTCGAALLTPVLATATLGQINVLLMLAVMLDCSDRVPERWRGVATGVAAGLKVWPLLVVVYFVCIGRYRAAATAAASFVATIAVGFVVLPHDSWAYWIDGVAFETDRVAKLDDVQNQSIAGVLARADVGWWVPVAVLVAIVGLWAARHAHRRGDDLLAVVFVGFTAVLVSPVSWPHHAVWVVPGLFWLWSVDRKELWFRAVRIAATAWCFVPLFVIAVPADWRDRRLTALEQAAVASTGYTVVLLIVFACAARAYTRPRERT